MATHATIAVMHGTKIKAVTVHWDGYLEGVGKTLFESYDSPRANNLVALGNISVLAKEIDPRSPLTHSFDTPEKDVTIFYGRDRSETDVGFQVFNNVTELFDFYGDEHTYLMKDGVWFYSRGDMDDDGFTPLEDELLNLALVTK